MRALIDRALAGGECVGPQWKRSRWAVTEHGAGVLSESEDALGSRMAESRSGG